MAITVEVKNILDRLNLHGFPEDVIFTNNYPPEFSQNDGQSSILITNISGNYGDYGSNHATTREDLVQIQFFPKIDYENSLDELADQVNHDLENYGFFCYSNSGILPSLDSNTIFMTMKFNRKKQLGGN